jgi:hypothetical protein
MAGVEAFTPYTSDEQPSAPDSTTTDTTSTTEGTTSTETTDTTASSEMTETTGSAETWTGVVNMELTGTQPNFYRLLDAVAARPDMIISSFEIAPAAATTSGSTTTGSASAAKLDGGNISINVTFMVYMMEK